jgi:hypothetical protein
MPPLHPVTDHQLANATGRGYLTGTDRPSSAAGKEAEWPDVGRGPHATAAPSRAEWGREEDPSSTRSASGRPLPHKSATSPPMTDAASPANRSAISRPRPVRRATGPHASRATATEIPPAGQSRRAEHQTDRRSARHHRQGCRSNVHPGPRSNASPCRQFSVIREGSLNDIRNIGKTGNSPAQKRRD